MIIQCFASSSSGNLYLVSEGKHSLLLEAGLPIKEISKYVRPSSLSGCLVTHEHKDHSQGVDGLMRHGVEVYMSEGTKKALGYTIWEPFVVEEFKLVDIDSFVVCPFKTQHDCAEPLGYLIQSKVTGERLLFATDTYYVKYKFPFLTHIMVECNYSDTILEQNCRAGLVENSRRDRLLKSHFSLGNVVDFLRTNDLSNVKEIYLLHLSDDNSDETLFKETVERNTGKIVKVVPKRM